MDEAGLPGFYVSLWHALWAPKGTPKEVVAKLNSSVVSALADPAVRHRLADLGQEFRRASSRRRKRSVPTTGCWLRLSRSRCARAADPLAPSQARHSQHAQQTVLRIFLGYWDRRKGYGDMPAKKIGKGGAPFSTQSRISPVAGDWVVELVGLELRTLRTITESQSGVLRRFDSGL